MKFIKAEGSIINADSIRSLFYEPVKWTYYGPGEEQHLRGQGQEVRGVKVYVNITDDYNIFLGVMGELGVPEVKQIDNAEDLLDKIGAWLGNGKDGYALIGGSNNKDKSFITFSVYKEASSKAEK